MMGRADTPVRRAVQLRDRKVLNNLPIVYVLTVVGVNGKGEQQTYGLFVGDDPEVFDHAAKLSAGG